MEVADCCPRLCHGLLKEMCAAALQVDVHVGALQIAWHLGISSEGCLILGSHYWVLMRLVFKSTLQYWFLLPRSVCMLAAPCKETHHHLKDTVFFFFFP